MPRPIRRFARGLAAIAALMAVLLSAAPALGHAELVTGNPAPGSTLTVAPTTVSATFDDELDGAKSSLLVVGPDGSTLGQGGVSADDPKTMVATIAPAGQGAYEVRWTAAASDGHIERGTYGFTVSTAAEPSATPGPGGATTTDTGVSTLIVAAVAGLVLGGGIGWWRRRRGSS